MISFFPVASTLMTCLAFSACALSFICAAAVAGLIVKNITISLENRHKRFLAICWLGLPLSLYMVQLARALPFPWRSWAPFPCLSFQWRCPEMLILPLIAIIPYLATPLLLSLPAIIISHAKVIEAKVISKTITCYVYKQTGLITKWLHGSI